MLPRTWDVPSKDQPNDSIRTRSEAQHRNEGVHKDEKIHKEYRAYLKARGYRSLEMYASEALNFQPQDITKTKQSQYHKHYLKFLRARGYLENPETQPSAEMSIEACIESYIEDLKNQNLKTSSLEYTRYQLDFFVRSMKGIGKESLRDIGIQSLEHYRGILNRYEKKDGKLLNITTRKRLLSAVKKYFAWLYLRGKIQTNPAARLKLPRLPSPISMNYWDIEQIRAFFKSLPAKTWTQKRNRTLFYLSVFYGLRVSEAASLQISDIDFKHNYLSIRAVKNSPPRTLPLLREAKEWIRAHMQEHKDKTGKHPSGHLFCAQGNKQKISVKQIHAAFKQAMTTFKKTLSGEHLHNSLDNQSAQGKAHYSFHVFRYSFATQLLQQGMSVRYIQSLLGHRKIDSTASYTKVLTADLKEALRLAHPRDQKRDPQKPINSSRHPVNIQEAIGKFLDHQKELTYSKHTLQGKLYALRKFQRYAREVGKERIETMEAQDITGYLSSLRKPTRRGKRLSDVTRRHLASSLRVFLIYLEENELTDKALSVHVPASIQVRTDKPKAILSLEEIDALLREHWETNPHRKTGLPDRGNAL